MEYDAIVTGAGPAGAAAAYELVRRGERVLVLDKSVFPRDKVCGEFVGPAAWEFLESACLREKIAAMGYQPINKAVLCSGRSSLEIDLGKPGAFGISRRRLDALLVDRAKEAGAEVIEGILVTGMEQAGGDRGVVKAVRRSSKTVEVFEASRMIDARGRTAWRFESSRGGRRAMFGFKAHYRGVDHPRDVLILFFLGRGYGGISGIENGEYNACFLMDLNQCPSSLIGKDPDQFMRWIFRKDPELDRLMKDAVRSSRLEVVGPVPSGVRPPEAGAPGIYRAGDAFGAIDPFFGDGIALALETGRLAAACETQAAYCEAVLKSIKKRFALARAVRRLSDRPLLLGAIFRALSLNRALPRYLFRMAHGIGEVHESPS